MLPAGYLRKLHVDHILEGGAGEGTAAPQRESAWHRPGTGIQEVAGW